MEWTYQHISPIHWTHPLFSKPPNLYVIVGDLMFLLIIYVEDLMITRNFIQKIEWFQQ
jgi:hypothetical protein